MKFNEHVQEWVWKHASPNSNEQKMRSLIELGFTRQQAETALQKYAFDQEKALELLLHME